MFKAQFSGLDIVIQSSHVQNSVILQVLVPHQLLFSRMNISVSGCERGERAKR